MSVCVYGSVALVGGWVTGLVGWLVVGCGKAISRGGHVEVEGR